MTRNDVTNWIRVQYAANSLYSVIADGNTRETNAGRAEWMSLINDAILQSNCNMEGFNVQCSHPRKSRIGILGNNQLDCTSCDSVIGFGFQIGSGRQWSCGNVESFPTLQNLKAFGYIFVQ